MDHRSSDLCLNFSNACYHYDDDFFRYECVYYKEDIEIIWNKLEAVGVYCTQREACCFWLWYGHKHFDATFLYINCCPNYLSDYVYKFIKQWDL